MLHNPTGKERLGLALLLSLLGILGPFNIDMYLPSFPDIADDLSARASLVQLSLTSCLIGLAAGQIIVGPISDAQGRRRPLLISLVLFALSSLFCALAPDITTLIIARFLQGFTAAAGLVISRAVVRDVFSGRELTKFLPYYPSLMRLPHGCTDVRWSHFAYAGCKLAFDLFFKLVRCSHRIDRRFSVEGNLAAGEKNA